MRFLTSGESHGRAIIGIIEGIPAGLSLSTKDIDYELQRRQKGHGRGGRMKIEKDHAELLSGVRWGRTLGSPIALLIENRDWENWREGMSSEEKYKGSIPAVTRPRPGHADLAGLLKYGHDDIRNVLERSSARETAARVAIGAIAKKLLLEFGIVAGSYVISIGNVKFNPEKPGKVVTKDMLAALHKKAEGSPVRCPDKALSMRMVSLIDNTQKKGDSLGGAFEVFLTGLPPGLGSYIQWDRRLDGRLAQAVMSIPAIKAVEVGMGLEIASHSGSEVMDEIFYKAGSFIRKTNNAGGIEGGMTNGMPVILRAAMKPIPTQRRPLRSVDVRTKSPVEAAYERSDICAAPAASVIGEAMASIIIADAMLEKFGGDCIGETKRNYASYIDYLRKI
jgi:chorismate synthase